LHLRTFDEIASPVAVSTGHFFALMIKHTGEILQPGEPNG
jgi:hypothetical protein